MHYSTVCLTLRVLIYKRINLLNHSLLKNEYCLLLTGLARSSNINEKLLWMMCVVGFQERC